MDCSTVKTAARGLLPPAHTHARALWRGYVLHSVSVSVKKAKKKPQPIKTAGVIGQVSKSIRQKMSETAKA